MWKKVLPFVFAALLFPGSAFPTVADYCGDGIDADSSGGDPACPGTDADNDGYTTSTDANDSSNVDYPGVYVACTNGYKLSQSNGTYGSCILNAVTPLCEAVGSGACKYIDFVSGNDANPGTYASPWKTQLNFTSYASPGDRPVNYREPVAGDVYYFFNGTYTNSYLYNTKPAFIRMRGTNGTLAEPIILKAYPGQAPLFNPGFNHTPATSGTCIWIQDSNYVHLQGLEVTGCSGSDGGASGDSPEGGGIRLETSVGNVLERNYIRDIDGDQNENTSGIYVQSATGFNIHHNKLKDNYDHSISSGSRSTNNSSITLFRGQGKVDRNIIFFTADPASERRGSCIKWKHAELGASTGNTISSNTCWNATEFGIGSAQKNINIDHNRISDVVGGDNQGIQIDDFGGDTLNQGVIIEYNTIVNARGLHYDPDFDQATPTLFIYRDNVAVDKTGSSYTGLEASMLEIDTYGTDGHYTTVVTGGLLSFNLNCYYNPSAAFEAELYAARGAYGASGGSHNFAAWQALGYDALSFNADPSFNSSFIPTNTNCSSFGWSQAVSSPPAPSGTNVVDYDWSKFRIVFRRR